MGASPIAWVIVAVVVVAAVIAIIVSWSGARRAQAQRQLSADVREKAVARDRRLRELERTESYDQGRTGTA